MKGQPEGAVAAARGAPGRSDSRVAPPARGGATTRARRDALVDALAALLSEPTRRDLQLQGAAVVSELAVAGDHRGLAAILRPDPAGDRATWTVACYQLGQLVPATLCDLSDPVEAVRRTAACDDAGHLAAELVASSPNGLRWTALVRTGEVLRLQAPSASTISGPHDPRELELLRDRWAQWLTARGQRDFEHEPGDEDGSAPGASPPEPWSGEPCGYEPGAGPADALQPLVAAFSDVIRTLRSIDGRLARIEALATLAMPGAEIGPVGARPTTAGPPPIPPAAAHADAVAAGLRLDGWPAVADRAGA